MDRTELETRWAHWLRQGLEGDEAAYRRFLEELVVWLRSRIRFALLRAGNPGIDAEDMVQETLLAVHLKRHTWRVREPLLPWIRAISRNKTVDALRRSGRRGEIPLDDVEEPAVIDEVEASGSGRDVAQLLAGLDQRPRRIVTLVSLEGRSAREAAAMIGISEGALRVALHRALKSLAEQMRKDGN